MYIDESKKCKLFGHVSLVMLVLAFCVSLGHAEDNLSFKELNPYKQSRIRRPANFIPDDNIEPMPLQHRIWIEKVFIHDNAGIVDRMHNEISAWENVQEYRELWDLDSTNLYKTPDNSAKRSYFEKNMIKYFDKRLAGEIQNAEKGSALQTVGRVQKALKPQAEVSVIPNMKLKFKAKVAQGEGVVKVVNPYMNYETILNVNGHIDMIMSKRIDIIGVDAQINYDVKEGVYTAFLDKRISDNVTTRLSSTQPDDHLFLTENSDNTIQVFYVNSF